MFYAFGKDGICIVVSEYRLDEDLYSSVIETDIDYSPIEIQLVDGVIKHIKQKESLVDEVNEITEESVSPEIRDIMLQIVNLHERLSTLEKGA